MTCTKCPAEALPKRSVCQDHWNEYMRDYRGRADQKREREARANGFLEGVKSCVQLLRQVLGDRSASGYQAAQLLERAAVGGPSHEVSQRRALIDSMSQRG